MNHEKPLGQRNYEQFAELYAEKAETKAHNAYYDRPATLSLLPDVKGKAVLDAGCGSGVYSEWLVNQGAQVTAIDVTPEFVEIARRRLGDRAEVRWGNLEAPLEFADASFDLIICPLVLDYIEDWQAVFQEFYRVLRVGGVVVYSAGHPTADFFKYFRDRNYFVMEKMEMTWRGFGKPVIIVSYRRPLSEFINPVLEAGFRLDRILEPQPVPAMREVDIEHYEELMREPGFLHARAMKPLR